MDKQLKHYQDKLDYEIDSWDLDVALKSDENITVVDARTAETYQQEHIPGAVNLPHRTMTPETTSHIDKNSLVVTYCDGIGCNASTKASILADAIASLFNPQVGVWSHAPFANEVERYTLGYTGKMIGLKLYMTLVEKGEEEMETIINRFADLGDYLRHQLEKRNWIVLNPTPLPLVCFTHPMLKKKNLQVDEVLNELYRGGKYWISSITQKNGEKAFRACITSFHTTEKHMDGLIEELEDIINQQS